jgi:hypothetical protein
MIDLARRPTEKVDEVRREEQRTTFSAIETFAVQQYLARGNR